MQRLAIHLKIDEPEEVDTPMFRTDQLINLASPDGFRWTSPEVQRTMEKEANAMNPPLVITRASTSLHVTLKNRMTIPGKAERLTPVILRAQHSGKVRWVDNIKLQYCDDDGNTAIGFGQCLGFFSDAADCNYVAISYSGIKYAAGNPFSVFHE